jgi:GNAT superfamily N-acetyltransferase
MKVRQAAPADIPALVALNDEVHSLHVRLSPDVYKPIDPAAAAEWFSGRLEDGGETILVAEDASGVVGYLSMRKEERPAHLFAYSRRCAYIDQVCVTEQRRGQGIFQALLSQAGDVARQWDMSRLELGVWTDNTPAKNAFLRCGFRTYSERMKLALDEPAA